MNWIKKSNYLKFEDMLDTQNKKEKEGRGGGEREKDGEREFKEDEELS